jgi:glycerol-3-phosphate dehydrogenase subunit C
MESIPSPVELTLDQCIKCNICTTACPVSAVTDLFPGPKYAGPQAGRFHAPGQPSPDHSVDYCSGCRVCNMVCPTGVKIAEMNAVCANMAKSGNSFFYACGTTEARCPAGSGGSRSPLWRTFAQFRPAPGRKGAPHPPQRAFPTFLLARTYHLVSQACQARLCPYLPGGLFHGCSTQYYEPRRAGRGARAGANHLKSLSSAELLRLAFSSNGELPAARRYHAANVRN